MKRIRPYLRVFGALALLVSLAWVSVVAILQSTWLSRRMQQSIIEGVANAIGARAEIPSFKWDWRTLNFELRDFSMRGFEPPSGPPLFSAPLIRVRLRILSLLEGNVQVSSLVVTRPQFFLTVGSGGATNIPGPRHLISPQEVIGNLINLKLPHVEAREGSAQINDRRIPLDLVGNHVSLVVQYQRDDRRYHLALQSPDLRVGGNQRTYFAGSTDAKGELWRDHFSLTASHFHSRSADVGLTGSLYEFNSPVVDWRLTSRFQTTDTVHSLGVQGFEGGTIALTGIGHHDPQTPLFFDGLVAADHFSVSLPSLRLQNGSLHSRLLLDAARLTFSNLLLSSPEGQVTGSGSLSSARRLQFAGTLSRLNLQTVSGLLLRKSLPWSANITGPVELSATLAPRVTDLLARADLSLVPRPEGIPVSGNLSFEYTPQKDGLTIRDSHIRLPNSQLSASGKPDANVAFTLDSSNLTDFNPALSLVGLSLDRRSIPSLATGGSAHLQGTAHLARVDFPQIDASLDVSRLQWKGLLVNRLRSSFVASPALFRLSSVALESPLLQATASGQAVLSEWSVNSESRLQISGSYSKAKPDLILQLLNPLAAANLSGGSAEGRFDVRGTLKAPIVGTEITVSNFNLRHEHLDSLSATLSYSGDQITVSSGQLRSQPAMLSFSGTYTHDDSSAHKKADRDSPWKRGVLALVLDTNRFSFSRLHSLVPVLQNLDGDSELHARTRLELAPDHVSPLNLSGTASLKRMLWNGVPAGALNISASTEGQLIKAILTGDLRGSRITGDTQVRIAQGTPVKGTIAFDAISLSTLNALFRPDVRSSPLLSASARGGLLFDGPLETPSRLHAVLQLRDLQVKGPPLRSLSDELAGASSIPNASPEMLLQNTSPVVLELNDGIATVRSAQLSGRDTKLAVTGSVGLLGSQPLRLALDGGIDLRLLQLVYPDFQIGGQSIINASLSGTLPDPQLTGSVQLAKVSVFSPFVPNGLSELSGTVRFDQHRATLEKITARSGGGLMTFGGFVTYSAKHPFVYRLESTGQDIRVRYANGISVTGNSQFSLTGTSDQSLLSGGITISRVVLNPSADLGNLLAIANVPTATVDNGKDYLAHLQMDVHVESAPNLALDTALSSGVQAEISLQLRGTPKQPIILGNIEANEGDIKVFGSRYTINRGEIAFLNPTRLDPVLDLDLQTQARGISVDITVTGTVNKLNINYRSDPPLQPRDIIALLTVGRAPETTSTQSNVQSTNDTSSLQSGANSVLGQAISPVSNRLSKLFGITNIKIDPLVQGITNTPQARLTLEQQISRQITVTYITNLSQTSEQIFRLEYALNPQFSLIALRDDNGEFGIDILYKKRFK